VLLENVGSGVTLLAKGGGGNSSRTLRRVGMTLGRVGTTLGRVEMTLGCAAMYGILFPPSRGLVLIGILLRGAGTGFFNLTQSKKALIQFPIPSKGTLR